MKLTFLGGVGTVTGSKYLLDVKGVRLLIDCGLFQGFKRLRLRNWEPFPVDPATIDAVILTHAHIDHSGYVPLLVKKGFTGPVYCTESTRDLCNILLPDSGHIHEKDAKFAQKHKISSHKKTLPLYTLKEAKTSLEQFQSLSFEDTHNVADGVKVRFRYAGHILGAAIVELDVNGMKIVFSGDLGRYDDATMVDPAVVTQSDYLLVESTYGNRHHSQTNPEDELAEIIGRTAARGGSVIIPSFAVGRTQSLMFHLWQLKQARRIPDIPIFLDSPMAVNASELFRRHRKDQKLYRAQTQAACEVARYVRDVEESKSLDASPMPKIIISASGMATGGRVLHHLKQYAPDPRSAIIFAGFQAGGTRGQVMVNGAASVKIHGQKIPIRAEVSNLDMLSAHGDCDDIMRWLGNFTQPPKRTFITHGEPIASDALRFRIKDELGWNCWVPEYSEEVELT
jgi:metallo-beta-lactamase family protein